MTANIADDQRPSGEHERDAPAEARRRGSEVICAVLYPIELDGLQPEMNADSSAWEEPRPTCICGSPNLVLEVPIHVLVQYDGSQVRLKESAPSIRPYLESEDWWGSCRACGNEAWGDHHPGWADSNGAAAYSSIRSCVERALGLLEADVDLTISAPGR